MTSLAVRNARLKMNHHSARSQAAPGSSFVATNSARPILNGWIWTVGNLAGSSPLVSTVQSLPSALPTSSLPSHFFSSPLVFLTSPLLLLSQPTTLLVFLATSTTDVVLSTTARSRQYPLPFSSTCHSRCSSTTPPLYLLLSLLTQTPARSLSPKSGLKHTATTTSQLQN